MWYSSMCLLRARRIYQNSNGLQGNKLVIIGENKNNQTKAHLFHNPTLFAQKYNHLTVKTRKNECFYLFDLELRSAAVCVAEY